MESTFIFNDYINSLVFLPAVLIFVAGAVIMSLQSKNYLLYLLCLEIMLAGINLGFIFLTIVTADPHAVIFAVLILGISAAEVALGIAIIILIYDLRSSITIVN